MQAFLVCLKKTILSHNHIMLNHDFSFHDNQYPFKKSITEEAGENDVIDHQGEKWLFSLVPLSYLL